MKVQRLPAAKVSEKLRVPDYDHLIKQAIGQWQWIEPVGLDAT